MNQVLAIVTVLLFLAVIIALVGIANTLGLSIFERTRELGLLRAVGMGRRQVKRMIRWESVIIAVLGALFGVVIGVLFGWALQQALAPEGVTEFRLPVGHAGLLRDRRGAGGRRDRDLPRTPRGQARRARGHLVRVAAGSGAVGASVAIMAAMPTVTLARRQHRRAPRG